MADRKIDQQGLAKPVGKRVFKHEPPPPKPSDKPAPPPAEPKPAKP